MISRHIVSVEYTFGEPGMDTGQPVRAGSVTKARNDGGLYSGTSRQ